MPEIPCSKALQECELADVLSMTFNACRRPTFCILNHTGDRRGLPQTASDIRTVGIWSHVSGSERNPVDEYVALMLTISDTHNIVREYKADFGWWTMSRHKPTHWCHTAKFQRCGTGKAKVVVKTESLPEKPGRLTFLSNCSSQVENIAQIKHNDYVSGLRLVANNITALCCQILTSLF